MDRILIVEDIAFIAMDIKYTLLRLGFKKENIDIVSSYEKAIKKIEENKPDMAFLDVKIFGKKTGIDVAEYLKNIGVPFMFITGYSEDQMLKEILLMQPVGYINKPFQPKQLAELLYSNKFIDEETYKSF